MRKRKFAFVLSFLIFIALPTYGANIEIASVSAHYAHPIHQTVEDSGNDVAIGQGMSESVLDPQALIETDASGQVYGTFRLHLKDQIGSYQLSVQNQGETDFYHVNPVKMKEDEESIDLRIPLPSKASVIRLDLEIQAMGRHVIFYGALLDRVEGNTDFIVSVSDDLAKAETVAQEQEAIDEASPNRLESGEKVKTSVVAQKNEAEDTGDLKAPNLDGSIGLLLKGDPRLSGDFSKMHETEDDAPYGQLTILALYSFFIVFGVLAFMIFLLGLFLMYYVKRLRYKNDKEEELLYDFE